MNSLQAKVNELGRLHTLSGTRVESQVELPPTLPFGYDVPHFHPALKRGASAREIGETIGTTGSRNKICAIGQRTTRRWATPPKVKAGHPRKRSRRGIGVTFSKVELLALKELLDTIDL